MCVGVARELILVKVFFFRFLGNKATFFGGLTLAILFRFELDGWGSFGFNQFSATDFDPLTDILCIYLYILVLLLTSVVGNDSRII